MAEEITVSVDERGRVVLPRAVREALGLPPRKHVAFVIDGTNVTVKGRFTIATAAGSIKPLRMPEDWDERIREAKEERADRLIEKMRRGEA
jgi:bifunctional DNA-binding transcriptional regulator/antitoxin component of YhaV-PrlF toxin-antitoxin module